MTTKNLLIVSHSEDETLTRCVKAHQAKFELKINFVSLAELLKEYAIFDVLNDKESLICWEHPNGLRITSADHYLLNRVLAIPSLLFKDFIKADQEYAQREFEAYLGFSFNAFAGIGSESPKGLAVNVPSLPQQWKAVNTAFRLNTPVFFWGMKQYKALAGNAKLVYSTVYNFLNWVVCAKEPEEELLFCFEKPPGQPVFILSLGHKQLITTRFKLSTAIQLRLKTLANRINALFNYFISEILFFVDAENCYLLVLIMKLLDQRLTLSLLPLSAAI